MKAKTSQVGNFANTKIEENNSTRLKIYNTSIKYLINEGREAFGSDRGLFKHAIPNVM